MTAEQIEAELQRRLMDPARVRDSKSGCRIIDRLPRIVCADGFYVSVQASENRYCAPREDYGPWYQVELGFPSEAVPSWMEYAEDTEKPTDTVYGWVPLGVVAAELARRGGIK